MKNRKGLYIAFLMFFLVASIIIWFIYKTDMPSTVTVQNGNTEVYNGVSIGDVVMALISIAVTALLGLVTYLQTQVSIEQDTWEKTPFFMIDFEDVHTLRKRCEAMIEKFGDRDKIKTNYDYLIKKAEQSNEDDGTMVQELIEERMDALGSYEAEHNEIALYKEVVSRYPNLRYIVGRKGRYIYEDTFISEMEITNLNDIGVFSIDIFNVKWDGKYVKKVYTSNFEPYLKDMEGLYAEFCDSNDKQDEKKMDFLRELEKEYIMPNCLLKDTKIFLTFTEEELKYLQMGNTLDKYIGFDIKTTNGYEYSQITKLSLKYIADQEDCLMLVVVSYGTELHRNKIKDKEIKRIIRKLDASQEERRVKLGKKELS